MNKKDAYAVYCERLCSVNAARSAAGLETARPLSLRQFYRRFKERLDQNAEALQSGKKFAASRFKSSGTPFKADFPGEVGLLDFTKVDLIARDPHTGLTVGEIWLGAIMDVYSRAIVAWTLSFSPPGLEPLTCLMRQLVRGWRHLPSGAIGEVQPFVPSPCLFRTLVTDNAWENTGRSFHRACKLHHIDIHHTEVAYPQGKSPIERSFRTFDQDLWHGLPGGKPQTPQERKRREIDPERTACLDIDEVIAGFSDYLSCEYHNRIHSTLGRSPRAAWLEGIAKNPPVLPASIELYEASLGVEVDRSLDPRGIRLHSLNFNGPIVDQLLNDLLPSAPGKAGRRSVPVVVRYLQDDLSRVFILNTKRNEFVAVPRVDDGLPRQMGMYTLRELKAAANADQDDEVSLEALRAVAATRAERVEKLRRDRSLRNRSRAQRLFRDSGFPASPSGAERSNAPAPRSQSDAVAELFMEKVQADDAPQAGPSELASEEANSGADEVMALFVQRDRGNTDAT